MPDDPSAAGDPSEESGPDTGEVVSEGDSSDGAQDRGPDADQDGENPSASTHDTETQDDSSDDALIDALASGKLDDFDSNGKRKAKPAAADAKKPESEETADDTTAEADAEESADADAEEESKPDLDADEQKLIEKARTKAERKTLDKLFKQRREVFKPAKDFADALTKHATEAGLIRNTDGNLDTKGLYNLIEQERRLASLSKEGQADYFRKLADSLHPQAKVEPPKKVALPQELEDAVTTGYLTKEDAEAVIAHREKATAKPEDRKPETTPEVPKPTAAGPTPEAVQDGYRDIAGVAKTFQARYAADWDTISAHVQKELGPKLKKAPPAMWGDLMESAVRVWVAEHKPATKKPTSTTRPSSPPPKKDTGSLSEAEELDLLSKGRL